MTRAEKRSILRSQQSKIEKMTIGEFEKFIEILINDSVTEFKMIYQKVLHEQFKFGDKRLLKLQEEAQKIYDTRGLAIVD